MWLLADVGGTNTRMACLDGDGEISGIEVVSSNNTSGLVSVFRDYLDRRRQYQFDAAAIAVAGPVGNEVVKITNNSWSFAKGEMCEQLNLRKLTVVNDFAANALALPTLTSSEWLPIGEQSAEPRGARVAIGPGTGLGVSALIHSEGERWLPVQSEGGHISLAAANDRESELINIARRKIGQVSAESFLSGTGLPLLYETVATAQGVSVPVSTPEQIFQRAMDADEVALETTDHFFSMLGSVAGDLALTFMATGGVYITGGIIPRFQEEFVGSDFRKCFEDKGRQSEIVKRIPTRLVTADIPAFRGLATLIN